MGTEASAAAQATPDAEPGSEAPRARIEHRVAGWVLAILPGALVLYFGFNGGGFFPGTVGFACIIVIQLLIGRVLLADEPFEGFTRPFAIVAGLLAAYAGWILLSGLWADARDRTLVEFDRALLYLMLFLLFGFVARTRSRIPWMVRGLTVAIFVVCAVGLFSRLRPDLLKTKADLAVDRLSYPLTYWNALGILAAVGILLALGLAATPRERRPVRALAAGTLPILAMTLYFTFSRGAIVALVLGLIVFLLTARTSALPGALLAGVPLTAVALVSAYNAGELASERLKSAAAISEGKHLVTVVLLCTAGVVLLRAILAVLLDRRLAGIEVTPARRRAGRTGLAAAAALVLAIALALGGPGYVSRQWHAFFHAKPVNSRVDLRNRLTDPSNNGRTEHWSAALDAFDAHPLRGSGAGTYEFTWHRRRHVQVTVQDAHSLYVEVMSELGIVGLLLLVGVVVGIWAALFRRVSSRRNRALYASLLGASVAWAVHAGVDWDWEMPGATAWFFAVGGTALASRPRGDRPRGPAAQRSRVPVAAALAVSAITPVLLLLSQSRLQDAYGAFRRDDCHVASRRAIDSIQVLAVRPQPYRILGFCDITEGRPSEAVAAMRKAVEQEPGNWESRYSLALALAAAGRDPQPELREAARLNPLEGLIKSAARAFRDGSPTDRQRRAAAQVDAALDSGRLTFN
jgi:hypothetical protein